ncbi:helix-turn-helix transcriptional regulator [Pseudorhodoferax soli]|uniref:LuxR family maltose regulon positive regulatory protein n=1 Tax=Pseudorhodoferax soli TaxID=545864 RepID=A0A368XNP9_9BURK|nr:LuxR C-terminal-related transcriptional regulator [Pseudorhodoferax soli]RCW69610.1 LuxR family maltose regulon positive regulatory protein [Pseudorhodoferax soli]
MPSRKPSSTTPPGQPPAASAAQRSGAGTVARERLLARLLEARHLRCIVVTGPAGAGKSTLLAAACQALVPLGFGIAWCTPGAQDDEPTRFLQGLLASVAQVDAAPLRETANQLGAAMATETDPDAVERLVITLVRGIAAHQRDLVLVIDDLHALRHPAVLDALQWLLDYAPPNLHLVLLSRGSVRLSLDRLRSDAQTLEIDQRDLLFTPAESARFLASQHGCIDASTASTASTASSLHERSEGWVAGLRLLALDWERKQQEPGRAAPGQPFAGLPARDALALTAYFEQAVCAQLLPAELDTLVRAAPCQRVCASLSAALAGTADAPAAVTAAATLLLRLDSEGLFVVRTDHQSAEPWYRLHPLLRDALLIRCGTLPVPTRQAVHARAFAWFRDRGLLPEAVHHAVQSGAPAQAAALVDQCAPALLVRGERRALAALLRQIPHAQVQASVSLQLWLARTQFFERDFDACTQTLEALARNLPADATAHRFHVAVLRTALSVQRDDSGAALAMLPQLLQVPGDADPLAVGARHNLLSWLHLQQGDYEQARRVQQDATPLMVDGAPLVSTPSGSLQGRCLIGLSHAMEGQMTQAGRVLRGVVADAEQAGKACADARHLALSLLADVLYELGDAQQARALLEDKVGLLERMTIPDAVLRVYRVLAAAHWQAGDAPSAFAYLERLEAYATRHRLDRLLAHRLADEVEYRLMLRDLPAAQAALARLAPIGARHTGGPAGGTLAEIGEVTQRARIRLAVALGDLRGAAARLALLVADCAARGRQRSVVHLLVRSAVVDAQRGHHAAARAMLLDALQRGHRLGLLRSLVDADPMARRMLDALAQSGPLDPVLAFYVERLLALRTPPAAAPEAAATQVPQPRAGSTAAAGQEAFSAREVEMLRLLAQALPNKKIARALALSPETVKWYLSRIYGKLGVASRDEAVARVRDLGWDTEGAPTPPA